MTHYYHLDSDGGEDTNLQLYSLKQAMAYWERLEIDVATNGEQALNIRERSVFVLANLGLSISQLLGQNNPYPSDRVPFPKNLLEAFVDEHKLDPELKMKFEQFNYFYNGCRHFGLTTSGNGYSRIDQLTLQVARECFEFGLKLWETVISVFREEPESDLVGFDLQSINESANKLLQVTCEVVRA